MLKNEILPAQKSMETESIDFSGARIPATETQWSSLKAEVKRRDTLCWLIYINLLYNGTKHTIIWAILLLAFSKCFNTSTLVHKQIKAGMGEGK